MTKKNNQNGSLLIKKFITKKIEKIKHLGNNKYNILLLIISISVFIAILVICFSNNEKKLKYGIPINQDEYLNKINVSKQKKFITFYVVNNPYNFKADDILIIYFDETVCYKGYFTINGILSVEQIKGTKVIHCSMDIIRNNKLYIFQDKSVFTWLNEFEYLYICFFPENQDIDRIHFFPQKFQVIQ